MDQKPAHIIYGVNDVPPLRTTLLLAAQHATLSFVFIIYPLMLVTESGGTLNDAERIVTASILAVSVGTFLQCLGKKGMGSGYLAVGITGPIYLPVTIQAARMGGLGLAFGMTVFAGLFSVVFSRFLKPFRSLFPSEVCGVAIVMLGISMAGPAATRFLGIHGHNEVDLRSVAVAFIALSLMVALSVWPRGHIRLYSVLIGLLAGYAAAFCLGIIDVASLKSVMDSGLVALPSFSIPDWRFQGSLLVPFLITALVSSLDTVASVVTCQKINQSEFVRPDMGNAGSGVLADGIGTMLGGALGTIGSGVSSANIALSLATGATARRIGLVAAAVILAMAFVPPAAKLLSRMPAPVMGAVLAYAAAFLITSGMELIVSRMLDSRRIFTVGGSIVVGLASIQMTELTQTLPGWLYGIVGSPFAIASLCAIALNCLFRIGTSQIASLSVEPALTSISRAIDFLESRGAAWGARRLVMQRAQAAVSELLESVVMSKLTEENIDIHARFDEYNLDLEVTYGGQPFPDIREYPSPEQLLEDEDAALRMSGLLIRQHTDRVSFEVQRDKNHISLHFDH
jgi:xanthine permease XanP